MMSDETPDETSASRPVIIGATLFFFALALMSREIVAAIPGYNDALRDISIHAYRLEGILRQAIICVIGIYVVHRLKPRAVLDEFGLLHSPITGLAVGLAACSPMLLVPAVLAELNPELAWRGVLYGSLLWPFIEEFVFRAYAFRQLAVRARLGMWPAVIVVSLFFGLLHLGNTAVQAEPLGNQIGVVIITGLGGVLFGWLYYRWHWNLWVPLAMHALMNLSWELYALDNTALGGPGANILRLLTVALAIGITLKWTKRSGDKVLPLS